MLIEDREEDLIVTLTCEIDLSSLNREEKEFVEGFIGTFDSGPNFSPDDLILEEYC